MENDKGFSLVSFVIILPALMTVILSLLLATSLALRHRKNQHFCQKEVLKLQIQQARYLRNLLKLNPLARKLRRERKLADKALKSAMRSGHPKIIMIAKAAQVAVKSRQLILRGQQQAIVNRSKAGLSNSLNQIKWAQQKSDSQARFDKAPKSLPVFRKGTESGSPTYHVLPSVEHRQLVAVHWDSPIPELWNNVLNFLNFKERTVSGKCAATIRKRSRKWSGELSIHPQNARLVP